jgi:hypothetical protein
MSEIDTRFGEHERARLIAEVKIALPAFLSAASTEQVDPLGDVSDLLNLSKGDLGRVVAVHLALENDVQAFVRGLQSGLRSPISSTERPRVATQAVRGPIDWGATVRHQTQTGAGAGVYVVRPARRIFDTPENRALAWALQSLERTLVVALAATSESPHHSPRQGWVSTIRDALQRVRESMRVYWLRSVPPQRPAASALTRLNAARTALYKVHTVALIKALHRYTEDPSPEDVTELIGKRYFEPHRDWQLFEVVVALRIARAFAGRSIARRRARLLVGGGRAPFARYLLSATYEVRLWYQAWPSSASLSVHRAALERYGIQAGPARPDLVVELLHNGLGIDAVLVEMKATRSASYLGAGVMQLLGYLKDRAEIFTRQPSGWLVAPASNAFTTATAGSLDIWAVSADSVADALVERFMSQVLAQV